MPWAQIHWRSIVIGKQTEMQVLLPSVGEPPFATLYLLHGIFGDSTNWLRYTRLEWYLRDLPLIVVLPDGDRGFFTDNEEGPAYARYMGEELPSFIERNFHARPARGARAIGGLSMGGYGALRVALGYPERFCSVHSHSGAVMRLNLDVGPRRAMADPTLRRHPPEFLDELRRVFGRRPMGTKHDLLALIRLARRRHRRLPQIWIDCGTEDSLLEANRDLHRRLGGCRVPHMYREFPGDHDWDYWDLHIRDAIAFHARNLRLLPAAK
jgi:S-formylglutathione hydrolase FrmB